MDLVLHVDSQFISPWAMSAFVGLEEKGLPYRLEVQQLGQPFSGTYGGRTRKIPALQHGDFWLCESTAILEYLAETFPFPKHPRLFPENLQQRARCRELQSWLRTDFMALRAERPTSTFLGPRATTPLSDAARADVKKLFDGLEPLLSHGRTTLFEAWCIADVEVALVLQRLVLNAEPVPETLRRYAETNWARPSVVKWLAQRKA